MTWFAVPVLRFPGAVLLAAAARSITAVVRALQDRREVRNLAEFDDRMLKDIGLTRSDVQSALAEPLLQNPSVMLVRCAERHSRAERMVPPARKKRPAVPTVTPGRLCA